MLLATVRSLGLSSLFALPFAVVFAIAPSVQAQDSTSVVSQSPVEIQSEDLSDPNNLRPLTQSDSLLSLQGGQRLMAEASQAIDGQNYDLAAKKLQEARQVFNQLSNFYQQLSESFTGIDNRISEAQRRKALETAQMRDQSTYQLSLVHRAQNQPELSVPLLIQVIRSQNPTSELGKKAYQQLFELGFVDSPYQNRGDSQSSSTSNR